MRRVKRLTLLALLCGTLLSPLAPLYAAEEGTGQPIRADKLLQKRTAEEEKKQKAAEKKEETPVQRPAQDPATLEKRVELAQKMHDIRPTSEQVQSAIIRASQSVPLEERESFIAAMSTVLNYKAIERISVDAMAEVYTVPELEAMVAYYGKPEAKSASKEKSKKWTAVINKEIGGVIDKAMMRIRTGALKDKAPENENSTPAPEEAVSADDLLKDRAQEPAQKEEAQPDEKTEQPDVAKDEQQDPATLEHRMELAKTMHGINPLTPQIDGEVRRASLTVPLKDREPFIAAMTTVINHKAIEEISIRAMAEIYSVAELEAMVDYYGKPEAKSATAKIGDWARMVQPQLSRIIDRAIMRVRTGAPN
jgi:hypothetical protein